MAYLQTKAPKSSPVCTYFSAASKRGRSLFWVRQGRDTKMWRKHATYVTHGFKSYLKEHFHFLDSNFDDILRQPSPTEGTNNCVGWWVRHQHWLNLETRTIIYQPDTKTRTISWQRLQIQYSLSLDSQTQKPTYHPLIAWPCWRNIQGWVIKVEAWRVTGKVVGYPTMQGINLSVAIASP